MVPERKTYIYIMVEQQIYTSIVYWESSVSKWFKNITYWFYDLLRNTPALDLHRCQKNLGLREEFGKIEHLPRLEIGLESLHHQGPVVHERWSFLQKVRWLLVESKHQPENVKDQRNNIVCSESCQAIRYDMIYLQKWFFHLIM